MAADGSGGTTRRQALKLCVAGAAAWGLPTLAAPPHDDGALDEALRLVHDAEPKCRRGLSTHAPMVAEALCALGLSDRAVAFVRGYGGPILDLPRPSTPIDRERWRSALGPRPGAASWEDALVRWGDWKAFLLDELAAARWQDVLDTWVARLAPALASAATHGVIRTSHAARALSRRDTPERRGELARGLAYWAAAYEELPARARAAAPAASYADALARVPLHFRIHGRRPSGNIVSGLHQAGLLPGFADVRDLAAAPTDASAALSALTATFAGVYLRHGTRHDAIAFVHAITGPSALRRLAPHIRPETALAAFPYAWQAAAGIYAAYARPDDPPAAAAEPRLSPSELARRAADNGDDHAIKLTEALLVEHAVRPDPAYLAAAQDAVVRL